MEISSLGKGVWVANVLSRLSSCYNVGHQQKCKAENTVGKFCESLWVFPVDEGIPPVFAYKKTAGVTYAGIHPELTVSQVQLISLSEMQKYSGTI